MTGKVNGWLRARHMRDLFSVEIGEEGGLPTLTYAFNEAAWQDLRATLLGKTLLFTDNHDWSDADIVRGYRAQHHIEGAFRQMKRPHRILLILSSLLVAAQFPCDVAADRPAGGNRMGPAEAYGQLGHTKIGRKPLGNIVL